LGDGEIRKTERLVLRDFLAEDLVAARAMITLGLRAAGFHRIYAHCVAENTASARVLEKLGLRQEARLCDHDWMRDRWWDQLIYAILQEEWRG
jgi:ribosomal-protein-alanine N-acetyltransferase